MAIHACQMKEDNLTLPERYLFLSSRVSENSDFDWIGTVLFELFCKNTISATELTQLSNSLNEEEES